MNSLGAGSFVLRWIPLVKVREGSSKAELRFKTSSISVNQTEQKGNNGVNLRIWVFLGQERELMGMLL